MASTANSPSTFITLPNFSKTCRGSIFKKKKLFNFVSKKVVSCKANNADSSLNRFDRRDILLGFGGSFYGATNLLGGDPFALAAPIAAPDLSHCAEATVQPTGGVQTTMEALRLMRELDKDDPRSFMQQANVHCAYCNDAYPQTLEMVRTKTPSLFFVKAYRAGSTPDPGAGSVENGSHIAVHMWVGDKEEPYHEDMGNFYSAGRDPIFYAHHANVDRMWNIWKTLPGKKRRDIDDSDWLDSAFLLYDKNKDLVRVKVRDCLDSRALGRGRAPRPPPPSGRAPGQAMAVEINNTIAFLIVLDKIVRFEVPRPKKSRTKIGKKDDDDDEEEEEEEVLVIENIQLDKDAPVKFDVCINDDDDENDGKPVGPEDSEFIGSFTNLPHGHGQPGAKHTTTLTFSISGLLEELGIEGEDNIVVTLVPQEGEGLVSIGNVKIDYIRD
ncbi:polyphenol oxidase, chloroplastic-like [Gossypium australe]|uniref:Polyphenol oxidase, chloroplastic-like n=1 Tax=Gossypium australe TaxID=47621 RepID=A0A5B6W9C1_9ROSI|nr:polyphenol oxidase, chloroplastic-like [Gossypium australe]